MNLIDTQPFMGGLLLVSLTLMGLSSPMKTGQLSRNSLIGIKTRHTLASDRAWQKAHELAAPLVSLAARVGLFLLVCAVIMCLVQQFSIAFALTALGYIATISLLLWSARVANTAAKNILSREAFSGEE